MSLLAYQSDRVSWPRLQPNQVDDWRVESYEHGRMRRMSCRLTLGCGHQIPLAIQYDAEPRIGDMLAEVAKREAREKFHAAVKQHVDTHDCAVYTRQQTLAKVTARLKE